MRWFRFYDEALNDPKVQKMEPELFKTWVNLLCLASKNDGVLPTLDEIVFALRLPEVEVQKRLQALADAQLLDRAGKRYTPHNWNARQYKSDVSSNRVRKFRKRQRNVSPTVSETLGETPPEQSRAETEQSRAEARDDAKIAFSGSVIYVEAHSFKQLQQLCPLMSRDDILKDLQLCDEWYASDKQPPKKPWFAAKKWLVRTHTSLLQAKKAKRYDPKNDPALMGMKI